MIDTPVLGFACCHDRKLEMENAGMFTPPCCLVFVGQDRQSWVPGPLQIAMKRYMVKPISLEIKQVRSLTSLQMDLTHTHT